MGTWMTSGGNWTITLVDNNYLVAENGALGRSAEGLVVARNGPSLTVVSNSKILGQVTYELQLNGSTLSGTTTVWGIKAPILLQKV